MSAMGQYHQRFLHVNMLLQMPYVRITSRCLGVAGERERETAQESYTARTLREPRLLCQHWYGLCAGQKGLSFAELKALGEAVSYTKTKVL